MEDEHRPTDHMPVAPASAVAAAVAAPNVARDRLPPHQSEAIEGRGLPKFIPLDKLVIGQAYELEARNLQRGIWDGKDFHGIRLKFGDLFMDTETHWDLDDRNGTAQALRLLE